MGKEIEKKYLVDISKLPDLGTGMVIKQGYIPTKNDTIVRIRYSKNVSYITIKSKTEGITRSEFEYPIPKDDAIFMLEKLCTKSFIEKTRYKVIHSNHTWEIDFFHNLNDGLIVAEVEINDEDENINLPKWVTTEVSYDYRYLNSNLLEKPFSTWK